MQTCPECGGRNEDGELFCGACGSYLEWEETQAATAVSDDGGGSAGTPAGGPVPGGGAGEAGEGGSTAAPGGEPAPAAVPAEPAPARAAAGASGAAAAHEDLARSGASSGRAGLGEDAGSLSAAGAGDELPPPAEDPVPTSAHGDGPAPAQHRPPVTTPAAEPEPPSHAAASPAAGVLGGLGGRAARAARRAADQATGGALSTASGTVSQARSQARSVTRAPGRAAVDRAARAAGGGALAQEAAATAREVAGSPSARPSSTRPADVPAPDSSATAPAGEARPTGTRAAATATPTQPAPTRPAPAQPAPARPRGPEVRQPAARKPGAPVQRRPVPRTEIEEEPPPRPGELVCGACGAGNAPHRHFCRRCGADLTDAPVQPQRSWWRRLLRPDARPGPAAGTRPRSRRRRRFPTGLVVTLVVLGLLGAGAWYWRDSITGAYDAVVDRVAGDNAINPAEIRATSERDGRPASYVRDGILDRSWAPRGDGVGESVLLVLPEPARLVTVLVVAGNGGEEEQRLLEARPRDVRLTLTTPEGEEFQDVELADTGEPQPVPVGRSDVEQVRLTILSVYGEELGAPVALAEVELRGRD